MDPWVASAFWPRRGGRILRTTFSILTSAPLVRAPSPLSWVTADLAGLPSARTLFPPQHRDLSGVQICQLTPFPETFCGSPVPQAPPACAGQRPGLCFAPGPEPGFRLQVTIWKGFIPGQGASHFGSALGPEDSGASAGPKRERGGRVERQAPRPRSGPWDGSPTSALPSPAFLTPQRPLHCCAGATAGPLPASPPSPSPLHLQPGPSLGNVTWSVGPGFGDETQTPELAHRPL
ncbi:translation initiation factor IF-2-like isoform X3 [Physeter macrocephalus]|uniref:Translation initiation factor IF-2-like isoform X3 n=1 Tax=Physeter macrocephalus TaxID=9755 RepID=A0A9W2WKZ7_PHYMC|nr:translation initiation factor IF-2-like isoform X3 [Physeter catodon]